MLSRRPAEDSGLPDRQICLSFAAPGVLTINDNSFYLRVQVMHEDIKTAGKHDFTERADIPEVLELRVKGDSTNGDEVTDVFRQFEEVRKKRNEIGLHLKTKTSLLALNFGLGHALNRYFLNSQEVSEDEYFAAALPYYSARLKLRPLCGKSSEKRISYARCNCRLNSIRQCSAMPCWISATLMEKTLQLRQKTPKFLSLVGIIGVEMHILTTRPPQAISHLSCPKEC